MIPRGVIAKLQQNMPDFYKVIVYLITGKTVDLELVSHKIIQETNIFEYVTSSDYIGFFPMSAIVHVVFNKDFTQMKDVEQKFLLEQNKNRGSDEGEKSCGENT